jgi:hypothetical protein
MKILTKIHSEISSNPVHAKEQYEINLYAMPSTVLSYVSDHMDPGSTTVLFSGGPRLDFSATYIEPKMFSHCDIEWKPNTIFASTSQPDMLDYVIQKLLPTNLLILHTAFFIKYRPWQEIAADIKKYKTFAKKVIVTLPLSRFEFHRLKYSSVDIANLLGGVIVDDTVVVCQ